MNDDTPEDPIDLLAQYTAGDDADLSAGACLMVSVEDRRKQRWAFAYSLLARIEFDVEGSGELVLFFPEHRVRILGWCLDELYRDLRQHRVVALHEMTEGGLFDKTSSKVAIKQILVESL